MADLEVVVFDRGDRQCSLLFGGPFEVGRQRRASENLFAPYPAEEGRQRLVVARTTEDNVSKQHALIEPAGDGRVRVTNLSNVQPIYFEGPAGPPLMPGEKREVGLPQLVRLGTARVLRLQAPARPSEDPVASLAGQTLPPGAARTSRFPKLEDPEGLVRREEMIEWFAGVMNFLQADPASSDDFYNRASRSLVEMVELDAGRVLFHEDGQWQQRAVHVAPSHLGRPFRAASQTLLQKVLANKRTYWEAPAALSGAPESMLGLESVVASPILDRDGAVIGALYGERELRLAPGPGTGGPITKLEAMLVELLAQGVAAGLARLDEERKAGQNIALFEQFFGPKLARFLAQTPGWEKPKQANVTVLFCDLRGFTRISKKLTAEETYAWVRDALDMLSRCVLDNGGVLVDYVGDEVMSMWGAPQEQADHASLACQAALDMLAGLPALNERWAPVLGKHGEKTDLTIGLNSGVAQVGNVGSQWKFKYGAQGPTVNTGSRVMNANKFFQSRVLMTRETWEQPGVKEEFDSRRLGAVRLNNVSDPVELHELRQADAADWPGWRDEYERALGLFERGEFRTAGRILATWREYHPEDQPALVLLARAVNAMVEGTPADHPVWVLKEK